MNAVFVNEMTDAAIDVSVWLQNHLAERCRKNPRYSMRAFATLLGMHVATLSKIISGKRGISEGQAEKICEILGVHPEEKQAVLLGLKLKKTAGLSKTQTLADNGKQLSLDAFTVISEWYHYAILEMTSVEGYRSEPSAIAHALSISIAEAKNALERLKRLRLLTERDGHLYKTEQNITNEHIRGATSAAHKSLQRSILKLALDAIDNTPQDEKDITSVTLAIDESKLPEAREMIKKFRNHLTQYLECGRQTRVYHLGVQIYPASKPFEKKSGSKS